MSERAIRITARIVSALCGLVSLLTGGLYAFLRGVDLPYEREWVVFVIPLAIVGVVSLAVAVLPRAWIASMCRRARDPKGLYSAPLKLLAVFATIFYMVALVAYFAPHSWNLNPQLMLALCPMYIIRLTFDPSPLPVFCLLAPMNAAVYGALGLTLGYVQMCRLRS